MTEWILSSSVLILGILVLRQMLRGKISLRLQYALWLVVLARLLIPVNFFHSNLSVQNMMRPLMEQNIHQQASDIQNPINNRDELLIRDDQSGEVPEGDVIQTPPAVNRPEMPEQTPVAPEKAPVDWTAIAGIIWLAGTVVMLSFTLGCNFQFSRMLSRNRELLEEAVASVPVYVSPWVKTPCLVGVFRPVIYLTPQVAGDRSTWNHVIRHEMTHLEHFDHAFSLLRCVALCLHWYNPLVWIAARVSKEDAELACDEGTIARLGEGERIGYGETLIRLTCRSLNPSDLMIAATTMIGTHSGIKARILYLAKKPRTLAYALVVSLVAVGLMVGCTFTGAAQDPEEQKIREFYEDFIQQEQTDPVYALEQFVYIEDENSKIIALTYAERGEVATSTEILNVEKLSEDLWAVEISYVLPANPEGDTAYNFVGKVDGAYKVMRNVRAIPEELSRGLDLEPYYPTGEYEFIEDVIDEATMETTVPRETTLANVGFYPLDELIAGTDIRMSVDGEKIILSEHGLNLELEPGSVLAHRNGYIAAVLERAPRLIEGTVYVHDSFYHHFLTKQWEVSASTELLLPSLFNGMLFFPEEVMDAVDAPDGSVFQQKLLSQVLLPTSMGIETPHIDMTRVFQPGMLADKPSALIKELINLGYSDAAGYAYGEYVILSNAQTCAQAGISNNDEMTVWEFHRHQSMLGHQEFWENLTDAEREFMNRYDLVADDYLFLRNEYSGSYMELPEGELKTILTEYYELDLAYLRGTSDTAGN